MKKITSLLLTVYLCFITLTLLTSCEHDHDFEEAWTFDSTSHWHVCKDESCQEKKVLDEHDWAQQEFYAENGDLVFDCIVCGARKTEPVAPAPLTQAEWETAFNTTLTAENVTWTHQQNNDATKTNRIDGNKASVSNSHPYNETKDCYYLIEGDVIWHYTAEQADVWMREQVTNADHVTMLEAVLTPFKAQFSQFTRNTETGIYEAASMELLTYSFTDVKVGVENGYVTYFTYTLQLDHAYTVTLTFSDYGTTTVTVPTVD